MNEKHVRILPIFPIYFPPTYPVTKLDVSYYLDNFKTSFEIEFENKI